MEVGGVGASFSIVKIASSRFQMGSILAPVGRLLLLRHYLEGRHLHEPTQIFDSQMSALMLEVDMYNNEWNSNGQIGNFQGWPRGLSGYLCTLLLPTLDNYRFDIFPCRLEADAKASLLRFYFNSHNNSIPKCAKPVFGSYDVS